MENPPFQHLLVATDYSESANPAVDEALRLARRWGVRLSVVHVNTDLPLTRQWARLENAASVEEAVRTGGQQRHAEFVQALRAIEPEADLHAVVLESKEPALSILTFAQANGCDLILTGTHGTTVRDVSTLGSVAIQVIRGASVPVLTVRHDRQPGFQRILAPVEDSPTGRAGLAVALTMARQSDTHELHVLHAFEPLGLASLTVVSQYQSDDYRKQAEQHEVEELERLLAEFDTTGVNIIRTVLCLAPDRAILHHAEQHNIDLICMGTVGRSGLAGMVFGNMSERILRGVTCSVMTAHPPHP